MPARLASALETRPRAILLATLALLVASLLGASGSLSTLGVGALENGSRPALEIEADGGPAIQPKVVNVAIDVIRSQLSSDPKIDQITVRRMPGSPGRVVFALTLTDDSPAARREALSAIPASIDPGPLKIQAGGEAATLERLRGGLGHDLWRYGLLTVPALILLALALFGLRLGIGSLVAGLGGGALAVVLGRIAGGSGVSVLYAASAAPLGLALGIETFGSILVRFRDLPSGASHVDRLEAAIGEGLTESALRGLAAAVAGALVAVGGFAQSGALVVGVIAGVLGGIAFGALAGFAAAGVVADPVQPRIPIFPSVTTRLASSGRRLGGARLPARLIRALILVAVAVALTLGPAIAAVLASERIADLFSVPSLPPGMAEAALAAAVCVSIAIGAGRVLLTWRLTREARVLAQGAGDAAGGTARALAPGAILAGVALALFGASILASDVAAAREFGGLITALAILELIGGRIIVAALIARIPLRRRSRVGA